MRKTTGCLLIAALAITIAAPAEAKIFDAAKRPDDFANVFFRAKDLARKGFDADFIALPPSGHPVAVSTTKTSTFPRRGPFYAIMSTGNSLRALSKNSSGHRSTNNHGPLLRGTRDMVMFRARFVAPKGKNCMYLPFKFLSEEYPEYVGSEFNDAFIAELDASTWDSNRNDPSIDFAPDNFAQDSSGNPISINATGDAAVAKKYAKGTTYDAATRTLRAATPITPGYHELYLSIFDQGDRQYDSSVFLDRLRFVKSSNCETGVVVDS